MFSYKPKQSPSGLKRCVVSLPHPATTNSVNATINHHSTQGAHHQVLATYASMLKTHVPSDAYTFPSLLKACSFLNLFSLGLTLHQRILVSGLSLDAYIASSLGLLMLLVKCLTICLRGMSYLGPPLLGATRAPVVCLRPFLCLMKCVVREFNPVVLPY